MQYCHTDPDHIRPRSDKRGDYYNNPATPCRTYPAAMRDYYIAGVSRK